MIKMQNEKKFEKKIKTLIKATTDSLNNTTKPVKENGHICKITAQDFKNSKSEIDRIKSKKTTNNSLINEYKKLLDQDIDKYEYLLHRNFDWTELKMLNIINSAYFTTQNKVKFKFSKIFDLIYMKNSRTFNFLILDTQSLNLKNSIGILDEIEKENLKANSTESNLSKEFFSNLNKMYSRMGLDSILEVHKSDIKAVINKNNQTPNLSNLFFYEAYINKFSQYLVGINYKYKIKPNIIQPMVLNQSQKPLFIINNELMLTRSTKIVPESKLSLVEKLELWIYKWLFVNFIKSNENRKNILILDEVDCFLNESEFDEFLNLIKNKIIGKLGIQVILVVHNLNKYLKSAPFECCFRIEIKENETLSIKNVSNDEALCVSKSCNSHGFVHDITKEKIIGQVFFNIIKNVPNIDDEALRDFKAKLNDQKRKSYSALRNFSGWYNLPRLAVITGKTGIGKTSLLKCLNMIYSNSVYILNGLSQPFLNKSILFINPVNDINVYNQQFKLKLDLYYDLYNQNKLGADVLNKLNKFTENKNDKQRVLTFLNNLVYKETPIPLCIRSSYALYLPVLLRILDDLEELNDHLREKKFKYVLEYKTNEDLISSTTILDGSSLLNDNIINLVYFVSYNENAQANKEEKIKIDHVDLSAGEKLLFSIYLLEFENETIKNNVKLDKDFLLLLDEPDANLHPTKVKEILDIFENKLVKERNMQVILTTHNPTTVSYIRDENLFVMFEDKKSNRINIENAVKTLENFEIHPNFLLTNRLASLNSYLGVCLVESKCEKKFYEFVYEQINRLYLNNGCINDKEYFLANFPLKFISFNYIKSDNYANNDKEARNIKHVVDVLHTASQFSEVKNDLLEMCLKEYKDKLEFYKKDDTFIAECEIRNFVHGINHVYDSNDETASFYNKISNNNLFIGFLNGRNMKLKKSYSYKVGFTERYSIENYIFDPVNVYFALKNSGLSMQGEVFGQFQAISLKDKEIFFIENNEKNANKAKKSNFEQELQVLINQMVSIWKKRLELEIKERKNIYENLKYDKKINKHCIMSNDDTLTKTETELKDENIIFPGIKVKYNFNFVLFMNGVDLTELIHKTTCESVDHCCFYNSNLEIENLSLNHKCLFIEIHKFVCHNENELENCFFDKIENAENSKIKSHNKKCRIFDGHRMKKLNKEYFHKAIVCDMIDFFKLKKLNMLIPMNISESFRNAWSSKTIKIPSDLHYKFSKNDYNELKNINDSISNREKLMQHVSRLLTPDKKLETPLHLILKNNLDNNHEHNVYIQYILDIKSTLLNNNFGLNFKDPNFLNILEVFKLIDDKYIKINKDNMENFYCQLPKFWEGYEKEDADCELKSENSFMFDDSFKYLSPDLTNTEIEKIKKSFEENNELEKNEDEKERKNCLGNCVEIKDMINFYEGLLIQVKEKVSEDEYFEFEPLIPSLLYKNLTSEKVNEINFQELLELSSSDSIFLPDYNFNTPLHLLMKNSRFDLLFELDKFIMNKSNQSFVKKWSKDEQINKTFSILKNELEFYEDNKNEYSNLKCYNNYKLNLYLEENKINFKVFKEMKANLEKILIEIISNLKFN